MKSTDKPKQEQPDGYATRYEPRFVSKEHVNELINLWHLSRTALAGTACKRIDRLQWAARWFAKEHPYISQTGAYQDLSDLTEGY